MAHHLGETPGVAKAGSTLPKPRNAMTAAELADAVVSRALSQGRESPSGVAVGQLQTVTAKLISDTGLEVDEGQRFNTGHVLMHVRDMKLEGEKAAARDHLVLFLSQ